jgi:hypothetical protein
MITEDFLLAVLQALRIEQMEQEAAEARPPTPRPAPRRAHRRCRDQDLGRRSALLAMPSINDGGCSSLGYERDGRSPPHRTRPGVWAGTRSRTSPARPATPSSPDTWTGTPARRRFAASAVSSWVTTYMVLADGTPVAYKVEREWVTLQRRHRGDFRHHRARRRCFHHLRRRLGSGRQDYSHRLIVRAYRVW